MSTDSAAVMSGLSLEWSVYIVHCADGTLYTGIARDVERRVAEHNGSDRLAARYTRARRPVLLVYRETLASRAAALRREHEIKRLSRIAKDLLIRRAQPQTAASG